MSAHRSGSFRVAMFGLGITAIFLSYQLLTDSQSPITRNSTLMLVFVVLCPPSVLSLAFGTIEIGSHSFYLLWAVIAALNAALYASVRALIARVAQRSD